MASKSSPELNLQSCKFSRGYTHGRDKDKGLQCDSMTDHMQLVIFSSNSLNVFHTALIFTFQLAGNLKASPKTCYPIHSCHNSLLDHFSMDMAFQHLGYFQTSFSIFVSFPLHLNSQRNYNVRFQAQVFVVVICMLKGTMPARSTHDIRSDMKHLYTHPFTDQLMNKLLNYKASLGNQQMPAAGNVNS